ncbi:hypothetical protein EJB05_04865, partial [Eragrostis curvula]
EERRGEEQPGRVARRRGARTREPGRRERPSARAAPAARLYIPPLPNPTAPSPPPASPFLLLSPSSPWALPAARPPPPRRGSSGRSDLALPLHRRGSHRISGECGEPS